MDSSSLTLERTLGDDGWRLPPDQIDLLPGEDPRHLWIISRREPEAVAELVDVDTGRALPGRGFTTRSINRATSSRDGSVLALSHYAGTLSLWNARSGGLIRELEGAPNAVVAPTLALDARGARLLVWNTSGDPARGGVFVYDVATGARLFRAPVPADAMLSLDGTTLVGGLGLPNRVGSWDLSGAAPRALHTVPTLGWAGRYAPAPDGDVVFGTSDGELRRWSPREGLTRWVRHDLAPGISCLRLSADGARVVVTVGQDSLDGVLYLLDGRSGATVISLPCPTPHAAALAPDGSWVAFGAGGVLGVVALPGGERLDAPCGHVGPVEALAFTRDGHGLASAARDGVRVWDLRTGELRWTLEPGAPVESLAVTPDGRALAALCESSVVAWDLATGAERARTWTSGRGTPLTASPDARYVLWGTPRLFNEWGETSRCAASFWAWDLSSRDAVEIVDHPVEDGGALHVGASADGAHAVLFTGARPWKVDLAKLRRVGRGRVPGRGRLVGADLVGDAAVGLWSLSGSEAGANQVYELQRWDVDTGSSRGKPWRLLNARLLPSAHGAPTVLCVRRPGSADAVELLDARTRESLGVVDLDATNERIATLAVSPDGERVAVGSDRGVVRVFRRLRGG